MIGFCNVYWLLLFGAKTLCLFIQPGYSKRTVIVNQAICFPEIVKLFLKIKLQTLNNALFAEKTDSLLL
jgi:hypothetical protein